MKKINVVDIIILAVMGVSALLMIGVNVAYLITRDPAFTHNVFCRLPSIGYVGSLVVHLVRELTGKSTL